jgi:hypothetical protein
MPSGIHMQVAIIHWQQQVIQGLELCFTMDLGIQENSLTYGEYESITNNNIYQSYHFLVAAKRAINNSVSDIEVQFFGYSNRTTTNAASSKFTFFIFIFQSHSIIRVARMIKECELKR